MPKCGASLGSGRTRSSTTACVTVSRHRLYLREAADSPPQPPAVGRTTRCSTPLEQRRGAVARARAPSLTLVMTSLRTTTAAGASAWCASESCFSASARSSLLGPRSPCACACTVCACVCMCVCVCAGAGVYVGVFDDSAGCYRQGTVPAVRRGPHRTSSRSCD
jgi:hypothetical protein